MPSIGAAVMIVDSVDMGTAGLTVLLEGGGLTELQVILANLLIVTPMLFVFGETLPKDLFARYSDRLVYRFSGVLTVSRWGFTLCGLLPIVALFSEVLAKLLRSRQHIQIFHPKRQVGVLVKEGVGLGLLSDDQSAMKTTVAADAKREMPIDLAPLVINEIQVIGSRCGPFPEALYALASQKIDVVSLISRRMKLADGVDAMRVAKQSDVVKVLLEP